MIRPLAVVGGLFVLGLTALPAAAQTWGQPQYVTPSGRPVGGTPLSEVETRSYVQTGDWADGYGPPVYVRVPAPGQAYPGQAYPGRGYGYGHGYDRYGSGYGYQSPRYAARPRQGYRDEWGYNDDRPPSARWARERSDHRHYDGCGCPDVYLYDR
ncbi:hypothetical protein [Brevundimonas sp. Root1279]|uniref:hypothetical protein n=1 Tax=Brevundimonas sp. Root1279 TaxID=1736443 RepID=UPI0006FAC277|nr:hypothetical protein [Brevundimonas sp. Root1279]KQW86468.1 hypothetical protein ASC65_00770 [Brevundimonas sp. Root1279]